MKLQDAATLIANDRLKSGTAQQWADLGCGEGLFSRALLSLLPAKSIVHAIDQHAVPFTDKQIRFYKMDFVKERLPIPELNGILMANSLHFVQDKLNLLKRLKQHLIPGGIFLLVEYDTNNSNRWVPYPLSFSAAQKLFTAAGFNSIEKFSERQSVYNSSKIYAACIA